MAEGSLQLVGRDASIGLSSGVAEMKIDQPVAGVLHAEGYLDEPMVIDPDDGSLTIEMLAAVGPGGTLRRTLHFGGDVMMGRRYQSDFGEESSASSANRTAVATDEQQARAVVSSVAPLMGAADASMVNLETVVGELSAVDAYPAKRFLLQSPPIVLDALDEMGVDYVSLGNNHAYDWQNSGVGSTIDVLDAAGIAWSGAGEDATQAEAGRIIDVNGLQVGVISATTVDGDFVNDSLPSADEPVPADLAEEDAWQYEEIGFRFGQPNLPGYVTPDNRRPGEMWELFEALEREIDEATAATLWAAIVDSYPGLQDWVARRGHGGAASFQREVIAGQIVALRGAGAEFVVVQIHGGFQFSDAPSEFLRQSAHAAVDLGADLVIGHHPHVVQGFEWYEGHLIAYSLGNFLFDQDFLSTFSSMILRVVVEGDQLLQARVVPLVLDRYRPVPASGVTADRVATLLSTRSLAPASSNRIRPDLVGAITDDDVVATAVLRRDGASYRILDEIRPAVETFALSGGDINALPACTVLRASGDQDSASEVEVGTDLLGWGSFEDDAADNQNAGATMWTVDRSVGVRYSPERGSYLHLEPGVDASATTRQVARSTVPTHRWYDTEGEPADGAPAYTLQLAVRRSDDQATIKVVLYDVNDTDPTVEPSSTTLHEATVDLPLTERDEWRTVEIDLSELINAEFDGVRAEAILVYVSAPPGDNRIDIDDVQLIEWRRVDELPEGVWVAGEHLRSSADGDAEFDVLRCR